MSAQRHADQHRHNNPVEELMGIEVMEIVTERLMRRIIDRFYEDIDEDDVLRAQADVRVTAIRSPTKKFVECYKEA